MPTVSDYIVKRKNCPKGTKQLREKNKVIERIGRKIQVLPKDYVNP